MDFAWGIEGEDYFDKVDHYLISYNSNSLQEAYAYRIGIFIDLNRININIKPALWANSVESQIAMQKRMDIVVESWEANEAITGYLGTDLSYRLSFDIYSDDFVKNSTTPSSKKLIFDILTNNIPIEDAVKDYIASK